MSKINNSGFANLVIIVVLAVAVVLAGAYFVASRQNDKQEPISNTASTSQTDAGKPLDTAAGNIADDIEKEINALSNDDYSESGLSDATLYE